MGALESKVFVCHKEKYQEKKALLVEPTLSEKDLDILETSWGKLKKDISKVGVVMFMNLFQTHPEVQDAFLPFQQLAKEDMEHSAILRSHALRVMGTVDKCLARIRTPEKLQTLMRELGERHTNYNARYDFVDLVGSQFVYAIKPHLEDCWSKELEDAWLQLFRVMSYHMKKGMQSQNSVITY
ncbi:neuroglobin-like isoform X3 [Crassostrea virginica]|uniref:Neuroglobin-like isoform X3 n=1 Tax=Crassostrea virginica TaxID=6565 RepID=A0A8B8ETX9_CRAVI|nr:neuroglobin-like isoform X3 [Crassostrea virginica]